MAKSERSLVQRILIVVSGIAFLGTGAFGAASLLTSNRQRGQNAPQTEEAAINQQLAVQERNYELLLEREPDNRTALEGLVQTRIGMGNVAGALEPLEKWAELEPENVDVLQGIAAVHIELQQYDQAIEQIDKLITLSADSPQQQEELRAIKQQLEAIESGEIIVPPPEQ
ncbi:tetratricopeptide repeat protein [Spirulina subsalsa FACHB-351]|uniref:Tetratricopeptide repeat protein n=1 Tax=Spirulina subsalsa FACHB-351 TaxID=234711 RepID=A0ABT3L9D6_9CYAN|nr:tetratricopeptide repeat protein [Spirulina subsalsa]MCW6038131.1 tetratricopeptide repeat protein [Spirulina subsalsa FACHB-351]